MTSRSLRCAAALALAGALAATPAHAIEWVGRVGAQYTRNDAWSPEAGRLAEPHLDLDIGLDAMGYLSRRDVMTWIGGIEYRRLSDTRNAVGSTRNVLDYRLRSIFFSDPRSPFSFEVHTARRTDGTATESRTGTDLESSTSYGAGARITPSGLPYAQLGYDHLDQHRTGPAYGPSGRTLDTFTADVGHGIPSADWSARYVGSISSGTYATDNYADHRVDLGARAPLAPVLDLNLAATHYLRIPSVSATVNVRQEIDTASALLFHHPENKSSQTGSYSYSHAVQTGPGQADVERSLQRLGYSLQRSLSTEWRVTVRGDASYAEDRLGTDILRGTGQSIGAIPLWRRERPDGFFQLSAGPTLGLLEPDRGPTEIGYGANAGAQVGHSFGVLMTALTYDFAYARNLDATSGWIVTQHVTGTASGRLGSGLLNGQLLLASDRRETALFGPGASRVIDALATYAWHRHELRLQAGLQSGISGTVSGKIASDGLFLPAPYDSQTTYVSTGGTGALTRFAFLYGQLRYSSTDLPDRPRRAEYEARGAFRFRYGAMQLSLEDRYVISEIPGGQLRINEVFVRAQRGFGSGPSR
jgi:hypothetical protein